MSKEKKNTSSHFCYLSGQSKKVTLDQFYTVRLEIRYTVLARIESPAPGALFFKLSLRGGHYSRGGTIQEGALFKRGLYISITHLAKQIKFFLLF